MPKLYTLTVRQFYADTVNMLRDNSLNTWISPRFIHSEAKSLIADYIRKSNDANKRLFRLSEGWSEIPCLEMTEVPVSQCNLNVRECEKLMKSTRKLPETYTSSQGDIFKFIASDNLAKFINFTTPRTWSNIQNRKDIDRTQYYYFFIDGYFYVPIPKKNPIAIENIRLEGYFKDKYEVYLFNNQPEGCEDCQKEEDLCKSPLDFDLVCPFYLESAVKKELYNEIAKIMKALPDSSNPDMDTSTNNSQRLLQNAKQGLIQ